MENMMPTVALTNEQVIDLVRQLPPLPKRAALISLAQEAYSKRQQRMAFAEAHLRQLCAQRNLDWDALAEDEREQFIDDLLHEN